MPSLSEAKNSISLPLILVIKGIVVFFPGSFIVSLRVSIVDHSPFSKLATSILHE